MSEKAISFYFSIVLLCLLFGGTSWKDLLYVHRSTALILIGCLILCLLSPPSPTRIQVTVLILRSTRLPTSTVSLYYGFYNLWYSFMLSLTCEGNLVYLTCPNN